MASGSNQKEKNEKTVRLDEKELMYSLYTKQSGLSPQSFLECVEGAETGRRFLIGEQRLLLGRSRNCNICLKDPQVSARHASIIRDQNCYVIEDMGSANGVFVNGKKIKRAVLAHNDEIAIGGCRFQVKLAN
jgi:pSer/pThr/pTyr-binding forkhead associated (FHA) protein